MEAMISGLIARSTASGWVLCILAIGGVIQLSRIIALQRPKMKELEIGAEEAARTAEATANTEIRLELRTELRELREEVRALREENRGLRNEIKALHGVIDGMRRENLQSGLSTQRAVVESLPRDLVPPATLDALDRIRGTGE
jgi:predicted RNase H-like nuclease (RuvC/YqgF family)